MRVNICSCLLVLVLGCNVTAEIIHQIVEQKQLVSLRCPHSVEDKVTWSREINGNTVDIFIVDGDREQRFNDPQRRYGSTADKSLFILRAAVSDSGKYFCNNEPAVELTVIPSGTTVVIIAERSNVNLTCPDVGGSHVPTWRREIGGKQQEISRHVSAVNKYLNIPDVQPGDSGPYYCDGKPAVYLNVTKAEQPEREENRTPTTTVSATPTTSATTATLRTTTGRQTAAPPTTAATATTLRSTTGRQTAAPTTTAATATTKKQSHTKKPRDKKKNKGKDKKKSTSPTTTSTTSSPATAGSSYLGWVWGIVVPFFLVVIIITIYCTWRRRFKKQGGEDGCVIYEEIQDGVLKPTNRVESSGRPSASHCTVTFSGGSNQNDPTYCTIPDPPTTGNKTDTSLTNESPYSLITNPLPDKKGTPQLKDQTYSLMEKPQSF